MKPDRAAANRPGNREVSSRMIDAGFSVLSFEYDPDAPEADRRAVVQGMYLAMRMADRADSDD